jgi:hypothetical protein
MGRAATRRGEIIVKKYVLKCNRDGIGSLLGRCYWEKNTKDLLQ